MLQVLLHKAFTVLCMQLDKWETEALLHVGTLRLEDFKYSRARLP